MPTPGLSRGGAPVDVVDEFEVKHGGAERPPATAMCASIWRCGYSAGASRCFWAHAPYRYPFSQEAARKITAPAHAVLGSPRVGKNKTLVCE